LSGGSWGGYSSRMTPRVALRSFLLCLVLFTAGEAVAQAPPDVQTLWDELSARWTDNDLPGAEAAADELVAALEPKAADYTLGIQMNSALHNRASLRFNNGDFAGAEADLLRSVEQARSIQPPPGLPASAEPQLMAMVDDRVRLSLRGLTNFHLAAGDLERATEAFREAQQIEPLWKKQSKDNPAMGYQMLAAEVSSMAGTFYRRSGDRVKATEAFLGRVEELDEAWGILMKQHGGTESDFTDQLKMNYLRGRANCLMELAELASLQEQHEDAVGFCEEAREAAAEMLPLYRKWAENTVKTNPAVPKETIEKTLRGVEMNTNYLRFERAAIVHRAAGKEREALDLLLEGMDRRGEDFEQQRMLTLEYNVMRPEESLALIGDLRALLGEHDDADAAYAEAVALTKEQYPEGHPAVLDVRESQALLAWKQGDRELAREIATEVREARLENLETVLSFSDEAQRLAYRSSIDPWSLYASLEMVPELYETVLRSKGIVLESILENRALADTGDPELEAALEELGTARRKLMEARLGGASEAEGDVAALRERIAELEGRLSAGDPDYGRARDSLETTVNEVAAALPEGATLVEYIRYRRYTAPGRSVPFYGAIVLTGDGESRFVSLEGAEEIDAALDVYAEAMRTEVPDENMRKLLGAISEKLWTPLADLLPDPGAPLLVAPDGPLNFLSFATLLADDTSLAGEKWPITYVTCGRDLLREAAPEPEQAMRGIANPDFEAPTGAGDDSFPRARRDWAKRVPARASSACGGG